MKRIGGLILAALLLSGCGESAVPDAYANLLAVEQEVKTSEGRIWTLGLFNPATGATLPACSDPLCNHTEEAGCPFGGYDQTFAIEDGRLYYSVNAAEKRSDGQYTGKAYRMYNLETGTVKELYRKLERIGQGLLSTATGLAGDWQYISQSGNTDYYYRVNYKTGAFEDLSALDEVILPIYEDADWLYAPLCVSVHDGMQTGLIRVDKNFENREVLFDLGQPIGNVDFTAADKGWIYYWTLRESSHDVYRYSLKDGTSEAVLTDVLFAAIGEDGIYYTKAAENPKKLYYDMWRERDVYDTVGGKIYACDPDGKNSRTVYEDSSHILRSGPWEIRGGWLIGDVGAMSEREWEDGTMQPRLDPVGGGKLVIDTKTGKAKIYE